MNNQIQNFLNYLLDTETTSERAFIETIQNNNELFQLRYLKDWEHTVFCKLQQVHRNAIISPLNNVDNGQKSEGGESSEDELTTTSSEEEEEDGDEEEKDKDTKSTQNGRVNIFFI
jgi:hypothetical protein